MALTSSNPKRLLEAFLSTTENRIIPLTRDGVSSGSKVFGAAIFNRVTLEPYTVATNNERVSPLLHGEVNCIQQFFTVDFPDPASRPDPRKDCIFFATHEPCSLCLSAITWAGFNNFYFLFTYEDSRDMFEIPHDIDILQEVFRVDGQESAEQVERRPLYNKRNKFFEARSLAELVGDLEADDRIAFQKEIERAKSLYSSLSETYQAGKGTGATSSKHNFHQPAINELPLLRTTYPLLATVCDTTEAKHRAHLTHPILAACSCNPIPTQATNAITVTPTGPLIARPNTWNSHAAYPRGPWLDGLAACDHPVFITMMAAYNLLLLRSSRLHWDIVSCERFREWKRLPLRSAGRLIGRGYGAETWEGATRLRDE